jgi:uncharacterized SAM-binding protein YcdF (DUF218 family)
MIGKRFLASWGSTSRRSYAFDSSRKKFWGIFELKERWSLSLRGCSLVAGIVVLVASVFVWQAYSFLAVTHRVNANILVVEGWVNEHAIGVALREFQSNHYQRIFTTGGPVPGRGRYINDFYTSASVGADLLKKAGVPDESLQMVPSRVIARDRTYSSAVALQDWFRDHNLVIHSFNILTEDCHARRTQLLFQEAFGKKVAVGIIAVSNPDYNPKNWWRYSDGVREVIGESIAYIYARFFFYPSVSSSGKKAPQGAGAPH